MRPTRTSTLWLETLGGLLIALGAVAAWGAWFVAAHPPGPAVSSALANVGVDLPGFSSGIAHKLSAVGAVLAALGTATFFGAVYLVRAFRWVLGLAALFTIGVWVWLGVS